MNGLRRILSKRQENGLPLSTSRAVNDRRNGLLAHRNESDPVKVLIRPSSRIRMLVLCSTLLHDAKMRSLVEIPVLAGGLCNLPAVSEKRS
jgi:hypothetical protein